MVTGPCDSNSGYWGIMASDWLKYANWACQSKGVVVVVLTIHQSGDRGEGLGQSSWTHNRPQLGFTLPSQTFMHGTGLTTVFSMKYHRDIIILWLGKTDKAGDRFLAMQLSLCSRLCIFLCIDFLDGCFSRENLALGFHEIANLKGPSSERLYHIGYWNIAMLWYNGMVNK
jgi:hypothetical protein